MDPKQTHLLRNISFFEGLNDQALNALGKSCRFKTFPRGEMIIGQLDESFDVLFLSRGLARVNIYSPAGKRVSFREMPEGAIFGEMSALDGRPRSASVEAVADSSVVIMPRQVFLQTLREQPTFMMAAMIHLTQLIRSLTERVFEFSTLAVRNRVQAELLRMANPRQGSSEAILSPPPTHEEIASRISTHREAVTRELARLEELGLLSKEGRTLRIKDVEKLRRLIEHGTLN
jgi:CRP/FNR family cyclic AMP-dependent transcriptional regulator